MRSSNVQGFVITVPTVYEEEDYAPLYRNKRMRSSIFILHSLYRNTQHYATRNCSVKTRLRVGGT